jgi:hypothetical protein
MRDVGEAVANLNTVAVGLDAVEKGHKKSETLNISWDPGDRIAAARKARKFVLASAKISEKPDRDIRSSSAKALPRTASLIVRNLRTKFKSNRAFEGIRSGFWRYAHAIRSSK